MVFDSLRHGMGGHDNITPMRIANNPLFTAKEKIELLNQLKADATGAQQEGDAIGFDAEEIDGAIAEVRHGVENGLGAETVLRRDF